MSNETEWVLVQKEKLEKVADGIFSKHHSAKENKDAYDVGYFGAMLRDVEEMLAAAPQPPVEAQRCTCPSGDGSLRWPCPAHPPEAQGGGDMTECGHSKYDPCHNCEPLDAPPSAPVGVAADILRIVDTAIDVCNDRDRPAMAEDLEAVRLYVEQASAPLAQQPAAEPTNEAVATFRRFLNGKQPVDGKITMKQARHILREWPGQQPAAVDGALVERLAQAVATELYGEPPPPGNNSLTRAVMLPGIKSALTAALAAQQDTKS